MAAAPSAWEARGVHAALGDSNYGDPEAPRRALEASAYGDMYGIAQARDRGRADDVRRRPAHRALPRPQLQLQREAARRALPAQRVPVPRQVRLLPAVLRRDGADAAHGRHPQLASRPASRPARSTATRASTACATSTPTPGSRCTSTASAGSRSTRRRPPRRPRRSPPTCRPARPPAGRSTARARASPRPTGAPAPAGPSADGLGGRRVGRGCCCRRAARSAPAAWWPGGWSRRARRLGGAELAEAQLAELRRALRWLTGSVPAGTTLLGLERRLGRTAGPAAARYAAALRAHRYDPRSPDGADSARAPRPAPRPHRPRPACAAAWSG